MEHDLVARHRRGPGRRAASRGGAGRRAGGRGCPASSALSMKYCASFGTRYASTAEAAPAAAACSDGYEGLVGLGKTVVRDGSAPLGRSRLYAYFASQAAT